MIIVEEGRPDDPCLQSGHSPFFQIMNSVFIYHHLGLGDHIICNGLVRELVVRENADIAYLPVKHHNMNSVTRMYGDDRRIACVPVAHDAEVPNLPQVATGICQTVYRVGFEKCRSDWDVSFYDSVGVPFEKRWTSFKCHRDVGREAKLESIVNPDNEPFILVHDTTSTGRYAFETRKDVKVIRVVPIDTADGWNGCLIDWCGLIDKAVEVHCVDSSLIHLCASLGRSGVFRDFGRGAAWGGRFVLPSSWHVIAEKQG